jgi:S-DNA-T family DNA segregation ATPase FtsK/SpoIIIE
MRVLRPKQRSILSHVLPADPGLLVRRRLRELGGLALLAFAAACLLALATWSVRDPSLSHATSGPTRNLLGPAGAAAADLLMQLFGLASVALLIPIGIWGWRLLRDRAFDRRRLRLALWAVGTAAVAVAVAYLPTPAGWPLPTGLGGALGDLAGAPSSFAGQRIGGIVATLLVATLAALGAFGLVVAGGALFHAPEKPRLPATYHEEELADEFVEDDRERGLVPLGLIVHWALSGRAIARRAWLRLRGGDHGAGLAALRQILRRAEQDDGLRERLEPGFDAPPSAGLAGEAYEPPFEAGDTEDDDAEPLPSPRQSPLARAKARARLAAAPSAAAAPIPGAPFVLPQPQLLAEPRKPAGVLVNPETLDENARALEGVLEDFGVRGQIINVRPGPVVTLYELEPAPGIKSSRVIGLADDIARSMSAISARVAVVPGRNVIGIELPNARRETVYLRELLAADGFEKGNLRLPLCLGKTIGGEAVIGELARMPHLLIAGTTGSGKSVAINTMILSLLYRLKPSECRLIMIDPKMLELSVYDGIPHLLSPVVTDPKKAVIALKWAVREMEDRYRKMSKVGVRNIDGFNARVAQAKAKGEAVTRTVQTGFDRQTGEAIYEQEVMTLEPLPYVVVIVDEMADLMLVAGKEIEGAVQRLAQMARAAGIHIIMATQRPSVDVITGTIKANFPTRISFQVTSKIDSRTILGEQGAEQLLGQGDMLYMAGGGRISRVHGPFVSDEEVERVVAYLKTQGAPDYLDAVTADEDEAGEAAGEDGAVFDKGAFGEEGADLYDRPWRSCCATRNARRATSSDGCRSATIAPPRSSSGWRRRAWSVPPTIPENARSCSRPPMRPICDATGRGRENATAAA